ncbi:MAG: arsenate reductase ArsC [Magnetospirillum sp.]|nr:arsenate reductase ArsC [Magnetospirillum sp.]
MNPVFNVLFVCRQNAARSQMAQTLLQSLGKRRFQAHSAGSEPAAEVHPLTLETIRNAGLPTTGLHPKGLEIFATAEAPRMDFVFTVCDELSGCVLPILGRPVTAHWPIPDPLEARGSHAEKAAVFAEAFKMMRRRIELFVELPLAGLDRLTMQRHLDEIGLDKIGAGA